MEHISSGEGAKGSHISEVWPQVVGGKIARHTRPVMIRKGKLLVNVDGSVWLYELTKRYKGRLLKKLQKKVGEKTLREIQFKIGEI